MKLKTNNRLNYDLNDLMITMKNANKKSQSSQKSNKS